MVENGQVTGILTEIVQSILEEAGITTEIKLLPWVRAYKIAKEKPNILIYQIIKLPGREASFKWLGPVIPVKSVLHKLKKRSDIVLTSLEDAKKYMIGTTRNAAGHHFLISRGFEEGKQFELVSSNELSVRKLFAERVDLESSVDLNFMYEAKRIGRS